MDPRQPQKRKEITRLLIRALAAMLALGCGGKVQHLEKPRLNVNTTHSTPTSLDHLESLIDNQAYDKAAKVLSSLDFSALSTQAQDRVTFLAARLTLAQGKLSGCDQISSYAQSSSNATRRKIAVHLALKCLQPTKQCSTIKALTHDQLANLLEMKRSGALDKRLACDDLEEVGEALQAQRKQIVKHPNAEAVSYTHLTLPTICSV